MFPSLGYREVENFRVEDYDTVTVVDSRPHWCNFGIILRNIGVVSINNEQVRMSKMGPVSPRVSCSEVISTTLIRCGQMSLIMQ